MTTNDATTRPEQGGRRSTPQPRSRSRSRSATATGGRGRLSALTALVAVGALTVLISGCGAPAARTNATPPVQMPASDSGELTKADVDAWLDGMLPAELDRTGIAGAAVSVVHDGKVLTARGYGHADTGADGGAAEPVDPAETLFRVGSVSKLATATSVLQLVESGDLDLDTDVQEYLDFPLHQNFDRKITLRHLLTHTAGFEERVQGLIGAEGTEVDLREALAVDQPEQVYEPGTVPAYSNYGMSVAGYVVERVSGTPFEDYVARNVFAPVGMDASSFAQPLPKELGERLAQGYNTDTEPAAPVEVVGAPPAGSMSAPVTDMAGFMLDQLGDADPAASTLEPETRALMQEPALGAETLGTLAKGERMTLGYFDESRNGRRIIGHGGDTQYFHSHLQIYPDDDAGIFITMNSNGRGGTDSHELRESLLSGFADRYFPAESSKPSASVEVPDAGDNGVEPTARKHAALAEGNYESSRSMHSNFLSAIGLVGQTVVADRGDGTILVTPGLVTPQATVYEEIEPWVWREVGGQRIATMRVAGGEVRAIGFGSAFTLLRTAPDRHPAVALTVLGASAAVLLVGLLSWPIGAITRWRLSVPGPGRPGRVVRLLTRICAAVAVAALAGWVALIMAVMEFQTVAPPVIHALQGLLGLGALGMVPAAIGLVTGVRGRVGWTKVAGRALLLLAFVGITWFAVAFKLLAPSVSY